MLTMMVMAISIKFENSSPCSAVTSCMQTHHDAATCDHCDNARWWVKGWNGWKGRKGAAATMSHNMWCLWNNSCDSCGSQVACQVDLLFIQDGPRMDVNGHMALCGVVWMASTSKATWYWYLSGWLSIFGSLARLAALAECLHKSQNIESIEWERVPWIHCDPLDVLDPQVKWLKHKRLKANQKWLNQGRQAMKHI